MPDRLNSWSRNSRLWLVLLLVFAGGVVVERFGWLPGSRPYTPPGLGHTMQPFWEAWGLVDRYYVDRSAVQPDRMMHGSIRGMLDSLGDDGHTTFLTAPELKQMESSLTGHFEGIGARLTMRKDQPTVVNTFPGSPAAKAGLHGGDVLVQVEGKDVTHLPLSRIVELVRGPASTSVHLRIRREGQPEPIELVIPRADVKFPIVGWHMLPGTQIAHLALYEFGTDADSQLKAALSEARQAGAKGLIVDVRGNPGGLKDEAIKVTSEFLKSGVVFIEQNAQGQRQDVPVVPGGTATDGPLVVLIDGGTASSAEIFAGALQDYGRGKLIGTRTFGTGTVLKPFGLSDGSAMLLAVSEWLTPKGRQIWHQGITPDFEVKLPPGAEVLQPYNEVDLTPEQLRKSSDTQLLKAIEVLEAKER
jgi:carboxyl-terminal processing protease